MSIATLHLLWSAWVRQIMQVMKLKLKLYNPVTSFAPKLTPSMVDEKRLEGDVEVHHVKI